ncbi:hypothetical protein LTR64_005717 [Lithohypha guttulata]|uniref:uncharacterized protein n=1 Tax=Lithohypha guttulata TaxID=1690604 RepID=UPI002DE0F9A0|nr:hypothetical protein LTR51_002488 [Lithohypha guttulata]
MTAITDGTKPLRIENRNDDYDNGVVQYQSNTDEDRGRLDRDEVDSEPQRSRTTIYDLPFDVLIVLFGLLNDGTKQGRIALLNLTLTDAFWPWAVGDMVFSHDNFINDMTYERGYWFVFNAVNPGVYNKLEGRLLEEEKHLL